MSRVRNNNRTHDARPADKLIDEACELVSFAMVDLAGDDEADQTIQAWVAQSEDHRQAFNAAMEVWSAAGELDRSLAPSWEEAVNTGNQNTVGALWRELRKLSPPPQMRTATAGFLALSVLIGAIAILAGPLEISVFPGQDESGSSDIAQISYSTDQGQHRVVTLADGSTITLGGKSAVRAGYDGSVRRVYLDGGEALFSVMKDDARPFTVVVDELAVTAVGTEFNIKRIGQSASVSVIEGVVMTSGPAAHTDQRNGDAAPRNQSVELGVGEAVRYNAEAGLGDPIESDPNIATSWLSGRLIYQGEALSDVIADVNRYYDKVIVPADAEIAALRYSGTVATSRIDEWLSAVEIAFGLNAVEQREGVVRLKYENL